MRLFVALLTSLSILHLSLVGGSVACAPSGAHAAHGGMAAMRGGATHAGAERLASPMAHRTQIRTGAAERPGDYPAPAQERCCAAMWSCGVATVASVVERTSSRVVTVATPAHSDDLFASVGTAPEPPPPKA